MNIVCSSESKRFFYILAMNDLKDYRHQTKPFLEIQKGWAWTDKLGQILGQ